MRTTVRYLFGLAAFGLGLGTAYWFQTYEWAGSILLWAFGLMPLLVAAYAAWGGAANAPRPGDDPAADPRAGVGERVGTFPAASRWPLVLAAGAMVAGAGLVYGLILLPVGLAIVAIAAIGLMSESRG